MTDSADDASGGGRRLSVFLCYVREDQAQVESLYTRLARSGFEPWLDKRNLFGGDRWRETIRLKLKSSDAIAVCISTSSVRDGPMQAEIGDALQVAKERPGANYIIPVRLDQCEIPERLREFHWIDLFREDGYEQLIRSLDLRAEQVAAEPSTAVPPHPTVRPLARLNETLNGHLKIHRLLDPDEEEGLIDEGELTLPAELDKAVASARERGQREEWPNDPHAIVTDIGALAGPQHESDTRN